MTSTLPQRAEPALTLPAVRNGAYKLDGCGLAQADGKPSQTDWRFFEIICKALGATNIEETA